jgi:hypothetical protein
MNLLSLKAAIDAGNEWELHLRWYRYRMCGLLARWNVVERAPWRQA